MRKFINHFSAIAAPLTNICKAKRTFRWTELEQTTVDALKNVVCSQPVLKLPDFAKPFEIHTDVADFAYGALLI